MAKNATRDQPGGPHDDSPVSAYEGRQTPEPVPTRDEGSDRIRPTGGVPSSADGVGPDADPADEERKREAGGAPEERQGRS
jgi:hypothetical protein